MAESDTLTNEELELRRRARRRLVGAIALALFAVVVLPMLFNPEPKPLGPGVDIRIPDQSTPFDPQAPAAASAEEAVEPATPIAQTAPQAPTVNPAPAKTPPDTASEPAPATPRAPAAPKVAQTRDQGAAPASEAFAARGYYLQLGAFSNAANAQQLADKARAAGFAVVVQHVGGQVRVRMGPYAQRSEALEVQAKLRAKGFGPILLGP